MTWLFLLLYLFPRHGVILDEDEKQIENIVSSLVY